jgi:L,D-transpeptidase ErfK/SrfK
MRLGFGDYLIHGTNNPAGLGMRVTHGCMRLYPEDIESLFAKVPVGTPVRVVNQPIKAGWKDGVLYVEIHPGLEDVQADSKETATSLTQAINAALRDRGDVDVDWNLAEQLRSDPSGIPIAINSLAVPQSATREDNGSRLY